MDIQWKQIIFHRPGAVSCGALTGIMVLQSLERRAISTVPSIESFGRNEMVGIVLLVFVLAAFAGMTWIMD